MAEPRPRSCLPAALGASRALVVALVLMLLAAACGGDRPVVQPIQFSHHAHTSNGLACETCHATVAEAATAGMPDLETCLLCHRGTITESPEEEKVRQLAEANGELHWQRIYRLPDHVYFSHRRHVTLGGLECAGCHGGIAESTAPPTRPAVDHTMASCMACHATRQVSNDCIRCHI